MAANDEKELAAVLQAASRRRQLGATPAEEHPTPEPAPTEAAVPPSPTLPAAAPSPPGPPEAHPPGPGAIQPAAALGPEYVRHLLASNRHKKGKTIQLDPDNHRALTHIAKTMGGITIADLLHNIVRLHFQEYGPAIGQMLKEKEAQNKKEKLPFQRL